MRDCAAGHTLKLQHVVCSVSCDFDRGANVGQEQIAALIEKAGAFCRKDTYPGRALVVDATLRPSFFPAEYPVNQYVSYPLLGLGASNAEVNVCAVARYSPTNTSPQKLEQGILHFKERSH